MSAPKKKKTKRKPAVQRKKKSSGASNLRAFLPWIGLIAGAAILSMLPVIYAEFTELDDKHLILEKVPRYMNNPWIVLKANLFSPHYKPMVLLSWTIEGTLFGLDSMVLHINNLLLHAFNSVLAFFIVRRLALQFSTTSALAQSVALFSALLFAVHPLHVESVAWAIERKDVLYTCFFFLGLLAYFRYLEQPGMKWMLFTTLAFAASVLSKSPAIMFPFILLLIDWADGRRIQLQRLIEKWPVWLVFVTALILFGVFGGGGGGAGGTEGSIAKMVSEKPVSNVFPLIGLPPFYAKIALMGLKGIFWYGHSFVPVGLSLAYPYREWLPMISHGIHALPLILALAAFFIWRKRDQNRLLFFTHAFFFLALAPALIRTGLGKGIFLSDRYVYLPLLGLLFFIAGGLLYWMTKKGWPQTRQYVVVGALVALFGILTFMQSRVWHTGETLWSNVIDKYPGIDYAYVNRAIWYKDNGRIPEALEDLNRALELDKFDDHAYIHRGTLLRQQGRPGEALADFDAALTRKPNNEHAINGKANVLFELGRYAEAEETYTQGLAVKPRMVTLLVNRAAARYFLRKYEEALKDLANAERMSPNYGSIYQKRTVIYMAMKDWENAVVSARRTAQFEPGNHANFGDLGTALQNLGRHQEAIEAFSQALRVFDRGERYYRGRARSYEAVGNTQAAQQDRQTAQSL